MNHSQSLPEPSADALAHSQKLVNTIRQAIKNNNGSISFRRYMEMALYEPTLGYYVAGSHKIGAEGDFTTAPEISPLFSRCVAKQCAEIIEKVGGWLLELGAGSGTMAADILLELEQLNQLPERYLILDLSPDLVQRQKQTLQEKAPHLISHVEWITQLPENFTGVILGNEVLDAMPVNVFTQHGETIYEHRITWENEQLTEQLQNANDALKQQVNALNIQTDQPYTSEINPNINAWINALSDSLSKGLILLFDYGYPRSEYYIPDRNKGTLICHYQHLVNEAPLHYPGLQDITANVDFTAVAEAADKHKLHVAGFTSQAIFLTNAGLETYFINALDKEALNKEALDKEALDKAPIDQYALAQQVRTLSLPSEMGERFKCIALSKHMHDGPNDENKQTLLGFSTMDQRYRL